VGASSVIVFLAGHDRFKTETAIRLFAANSTFDVLEDFAHFAFLPFLRCGLSPFGSSFRASLRQAMLCAVRLSSQFRSVRMQ
jgi:hypothetical protein